MEIKDTGKYYMSDEDFNKFLESIGGVENGYFTDRDPIKERWFFSVGNGWLGLVRELIEKLIKIGWDKQLCQVKEKFGGLRFYINSAPEQVHETISEFESDSYSICEACGKPGKLNQEGWWKTSCEDHRS